MDEFASPGPLPQQFEHSAQQRPPGHAEHGHDQGISGLHNIIVYDDGTSPDDIDITQLVDTTGIPTLPIINDPTNRIYRGLDPTLQPIAPAISKARRSAANRQEVAIGCKTEVAAVLTRTCFL